MFSCFFVPCNVGEVPAVVPTHSPHSDGVDGLTSVKWATLRVDQSQVTLSVQLHPEVAASRQKVLPNSTVNAAVENGV